MAKFNYRFEAIKEIKKTIEKKVQKELSVIDLDLDNKKKEILDLTMLIKKQKIEKIKKATMKVTELQFYEKYENFLGSQIVIIKKYIDSRKIERLNKLEELIKKTKETKIFEKLKENHFLEFVKTQDKLEQNEMDEFAVKGFIKG